MATKNPVLFCLSSCMYPSKVVKLPFKSSFVTSFCNAKNAFNAVPASLISPLTQFDSACTITLPAFDNVDTTTRQSTSNMLRTLFSFLIIFSFLIYCYDILVFSSLCPLYSTTIYIISH